MLALRPYQQDALDALAHDARQGLRRLLLHLPTGSGKTIIFSQLTFSRQVPTLILVHRKELVQQAYEKLRMVWPDAPAAIQRGSRQPTTPIVITTVQTLARQLAQADPQRFQLAICDEAHHAVSRSWLQVLNAYGFWPQTPRQKLLVGVSATLVREDGLGLENVFQKISATVSLLDLIHAGYLAELRAIRIRSGVRLDGIALHHGDYDEAQLSLAVDTPDRNRLIARAYRKYARNRPAIAFTASIAHAQHLVEAMRGLGIRADWVAGTLSTKERERRKAAFHQGALEVLANAQLLTEGYDEPHVSAVIMARPTKSQALYAQMIGRGTRLYPGKRDCLILDVADVSQTHDLLDVGSMLGKPLEYEEAEAPAGRKASAAGKALSDSKAPVAITGELHGDRVDLFTGSIFRWQREGARYRIAINRQQRIVLQPTVSNPDRFEVWWMHWGHSPETRQTALTPQPLPIDWAMGVAEDWLREHGGTTIRKDDPTRDGPPTPKQLELAEELGLVIDPQASREVVSHLLDHAMKQRTLHDPHARWLQDPATPRSLDFCRLHSIPVPDHATKGQVDALIRTHLSTCRCFPGSQRS